MCAPHSATIFTVAGQHPETDTSFGTISPARDQDWPQGKFWPLLLKLQSVWSSGITKRTPPPPPSPHPSAPSLSSSFPLETGGASSPRDVMTAASAVSSALSLLAADRCLLKGNIWDPLSSLKWRHRRYSWTRLWPTSKRSQRRWSRSWRRKERSCTMSSVSVENGEASVHPCVYKNNRRTSLCWLSGFHQPVGHCSFFFFFKCCDFAETDCWPCIAF